MNLHPVINYESAVSEYMENLTTMLRGFKAGEDTPFLETWVPDEDPFISTVSMFESGKSAGIPELTVRLENRTLAMLSFERLQTALTEMGQLDVTTESQAVALTVSFKSSDSPDSNNEDYLHGVSKAYRDRFEKLDKPGKYEAVLSPKHGYVLVSAYSGNSLRLTALIEPEHHLVHKVRYFGASTELERHLLEKLCMLMEGKPILECSDHAVIELEYGLRDDSQSPPVPGVRMPENCDSIFLMPLQLVRAMLADYREKTAYDSSDNFYIKPCSPQWGELSGQDRQVKIGAALKHFLDGSSFQLVSIESDRRVVVQIADHSNIGTDGEELLQLEKYLQQRVEPVLQVHLQPKADLNTIRKIKELHT